MSLDTVGWEYRAVVHKPKQVDGWWNWHLERRSAQAPGELAPMGAETRYGEWSALLSKPNAKTAGMATSEGKARGMAREAKVAWLAQRRHEELPQKTEIPLP